MSADLDKHQHHLPSLALRTLATSNTLTMSPKSNSVCSVNSPMTNLTLNLSELSTGRGTPRRKLSLSSTDTPNSSSNPTPERSDSTESGCFVDSPTPLDSPTLEELTNLQRFSSACKPNIPLEAFTKKKTISFRRFNSMPVPMMRLSPVELELERENEVTTPNSSPPEAVEQANNSMETSSDTITDVSSDIHTSDLSPVTDHSSHSCHSENSNESLSPPKKAVFYIDENSSQDSGVSFDRDSHDGKDMEEGFEFAAPVGMPPCMRKAKFISEDTCSPFKYSPVKECSPNSFFKRRNSCPVGSLDFSGELDEPKEESNGSPLKVSRLTSMNDDVDDGFLDFIDDEVAKLTTGVTGTMSSLFNAPVLNKQQQQSADDDDTPVTRRTVSRRFLQRSQSVDIRSKMFSYKRDPPQDESTPIQKFKRRRPSCIEPSPSSNQSPKPMLHRCHSESEAMIKSALNRIEVEPDLLGDCSRPYILPTISGKHQDLKCVSCETVSKLINGCYSHEIEKAVIVDCRYPYEYKGGHLKGAKNIYTKEEIIENFLKKPVAPEDPTKRVVLVFHCEFSSERGPNLSRFLRSKDREANKECYPHLYYPEMYLLEGGYKAFYESHKLDCQPQTYMPMLHKDHTEDLRHFRAKSKSWAGEKSNRPGFRPLKF